MVVIKWSYNPTSSPGGWAKNKWPWLSYHHIWLVEITLDVLGILIGGNKGGRNSRKQGGPARQRQSSFLRIWYNGEANDK